MLRKGVTECIMSQRYAFLRVVKVRCPINAVNGTIRHICLVWSTDDDVYYSRRQGNFFLEREGLSMGERTGMERV